MGQQQRYSAQMKAKVALEAIRGQKMANEIATEYAVHPTQITQRKKQALDELPEIFVGGKLHGQALDEGLIASLYQEIGQLKVELDWLKKVHRDPCGETGAN